MMGKEMMTDRKRGGAAPPALEVLGSGRCTCGVSASGAPASEIPACERVASRETGLASDLGARGWRDSPLASRPVVLFDFDGTLANTQPAIMRVVSEVLARRDIFLTEAQMLPLIGPPLEDGIRMVSNVGEDEALRIAAEYRELFAQTVTAVDIPLFPGTVELLDALAAAGKRMAVATSRLEASTMELLDDLGVTHFEAVCGRVPGVRQTKAESIAAALAVLGARPEDAVMVGDRMYDVLGATELGIPCIGVYSGAAAPGEHEEARAAAVCSDMFEVARVLGV